MASQRIQVTLRDDVLARLDRLAASKGLTRSAMLALLISEAGHLDQQHLHGGD